MHKTSVYLSDDEKEHLEHLARVEGRSQADIIREAIRAYRPKSRLANSRLRGAVSDPGVQAAEIPEEEFLRGFGE